MKWISVRRQYIDSADVPDVITHRFCQRAVSAAILSSMVAATGAGGGGADTLPRTGVEGPGFFGAVTGPATGLA